MSNVTAWEMNETAEAVRKICEASLHAFHSGGNDLGIELAKKASAMAEKIPNVPKMFSMKSIPAAMLRDLSECIEHLTYGAGELAHAKYNDDRTKIHSKAREILKNVPVTWSFGLDADGTCAVCGSHVDRAPRDAKMVLAELKVVQEFDDRLESELKSMGYQWVTDHRASEELEGILKKDYTP